GLEGFRDARPLRLLHLLRHARKRPPRTAPPAIPHGTSLAGRLHSNGPKGGMWNEAWRDFKRKNNGAQAEEIFKHAGELIYRFQLLGGPIEKYN
ncbi:DUF2380 domain-containing protein, partial [Corallococcus sp. AB030]